MDLKKCYHEEDLFPKIFATYEERYYGLLFYDENNKESYYSNHALIYKDKIDDLHKVLEDIKSFYFSKKLKVFIFQSMLDDGYFNQIKKDLEKEGFKILNKEQKYMLPLAENEIVPNKNIKVSRHSNWDESYSQVFIEAELPWEVKIAREIMKTPSAFIFVALKDDKLIGLLYGHFGAEVCRADYLIVSKNGRGMGVGGTLFYSFVKWIKQEKIENTYVWPGGPIPEKIYFKGGYRHVDTKYACRAILEE